MEQRQRYNLPRVSGLMRPFPDQSSASFMQTLTLNDVNSETYRQQIIQMYRVQGSGESGSDPSLIAQNQAGVPTENMFTTSKDEDKKFEVFPEASMKSGPIYKTAPKYESGVYRFHAITGQALNQRLQTCRDLQQQNIKCGDSVPCEYDYTTLNAKTSSMHSAYMQGDVARFECVQSHWIKGVHEYKCGIVVDYNRPNEYRFEWNKGEQPWCRSREKENFLIWLSAILGTIAIIMSYETEPLQEKPRYTDILPRESSSRRTSPPPIKGYRLDEHLSMPSHASTPESAARPGSNLHGYNTSV
ncbi:unnamed protein product [Nippostrongylus brasiliensis]|uniref:Protein mesh (inferred by orthology to a D. melanogaster protein) n=1 Tax=Nippostrongylus brasiliensis TaxID=27835 RepID=A0A0N4YPG9_NIPBR|nr:unnamed protein product [Nippostrongylus brasiliensis]